MAIQWNVDNSNWSGAKKKIRVFENSTYRGSRYRGFTVIEMKINLSHEKIKFLVVCKVGIQKKVNNNIKCMWCDTGA